VSAAEPAPEPALRLRMLNACRCGRQYDVSLRRPGELVRCECGERFAAEFREPKSPRALRCSGCGANLRAAAVACDYCGAEVTLEERRLASICPQCYARAGVDARFCMECGTRIAPQALAALAQQTACPRCKGELRSRTLGTASVAECGACGGLWLSEEHFERVCERADGEEQALRGLLLHRPAIAPPRESQLRYVPCVECGELMNRRNYASSSGVILDVCRDHGVWLDHAELDKILAFVRAGGLDRSRARQIERLADQERRARGGRAAAEPFGAPPERARQILLGSTLLDWVVELVRAIR
jgi:Zn-finger nucleic acid-binding protein